MLILCRKPGRECNEIKTPETNPKNIRTMLAIPEAALTLPEKSPMVKPRALNGATPSTAYITASTQSENDGVHPEANNRRLRRKMDM